MGRVPFEELHCQPDNHLAVLVPVLAARTVVWCTTVPWCTLVCCVVVMPPIVVDDTPRVLLKLGRRFCWGVSSSDPTSEMLLRLAMVARLAMLAMLEEQGDAAARAAAVEHTGVACPTAMAVLLQPEGQPGSLRRTWSRAESLDGALDSIAVLVGEAEGLAQLPRLLAGRGIDPWRQSRGTMPLVADVVGQPLAPDTEPRGLPDVPMGAAGAAPTTATRSSSLRLSTDALRAVTPCAGPC